MTEPIEPLAPPPWTVRARWDRERWFVNIIRPDHSLAGSFLSGSLDDAEPHARRLLALTGDPNLPLVVEVDGFGAAARHVDLADEIRSGIWRPDAVLLALLHEAEMALGDLGLADHDIALLVGDTRHAPTIGFRPEA